MYKVSVSDDKSEFLKQLLDNLNISYASADNDERLVKKEDLKSQAKDSLNDPDGTLKRFSEEQKSLQDVLKKLDQMRR